MCGIVGAVSNDNVASYLLDGLRRLEYRGYDSAGIAVVERAGKLKRSRTIGRVDALADVLANRPLRGWAGYETPIRNLFLCGAGTHPGGEVTGACGHNAAHAILERA